MKMIKNDTFIMNNTLAIPLILISHGGEIHYAASLAQETTEMNSNLKLRDTTVLS